MKLLATHNDLDGTGSLILSKYFNLGFDQTIVLDYNFEETKQNKKDKILEFSDISFTDFCPSKNFLLLLLDQGKTISIYDHHESSKWCNDIIHKNLKVYHDMTSSGTKIFFNNYIKTIFKRVKLIIFDFVHLVNTYDCWKITSPLWEESQNLNRLLYKMMDWDSEDQIYSRFIEAIIKKLDLLSKWEWSNYEARLIHSAVEQENKVYLESKSILQKRKDDRGKTFGLFKASSKISIVCSRLLAENLDLDYIICINMYKKDECKLSCRSLGFNTTTLSIFDGHKEASGGQMDSIEDIDKLWKGEINSITYKNT